MPKTLNTLELIELVERNEGSLRRSAKEYGRDQATLWRMLKRRGILSGKARDEAILEGRPWHQGDVQVGRGKKASTVPSSDGELQGEPEAAGTKDTLSHTYKVRGNAVKSLEQVLEIVEADLNVWEVERWLCNKWEVGAKDESNEIVVTDLWQVKVWFRRRTQEEQTMIKLIEGLRERSIHIESLHNIETPSNPKPSRALEICVADPHLGMHCRPPSADSEWSFELCRDMYREAICSLMGKAEAYGPFDEIVWVFGHDYLHSDTIWGETTAHTNQPDAETWHTAFLEGKLLAFQTADYLSELAPLRIIQISGNHDRMSSYALGHVLDAYYHNDANVTVDCSSAPYKFWSYGVNLLGFDHGHAKNLGMLPALMAAETRTTHWQDARYCEWHLGDQHRKGSGRPIAMAEQGVGVEFLTGLTPANEWHKIKTFNWQPRGATAYVWNRDTGPEARLHFNIDSYTGKAMGE